MIGDVASVPTKLSCLRASHASTYDEAAEGEATVPVPAVGEKRLMGAEGESTLCRASSGTGFAAGVNSLETSFPVESSAAGSTGTQKLSVAGRSPGESVSTPTED
jgi:hypothetical protein